MYKNIVAIKSYLKKYEMLGSKNQYCYHDPKQPQYAIKEVVRMSTVIHGMLWPSLFLLIGISILMGFIFKLPTRIQNHVAKHRTVDRKSKRQSGYQLMTKHKEASQSL